MMTALSCDFSALLLRTMANGSWLRSEEVQHCVGCGIELGQLKATAEHGFEVEASASVVDLIAVSIRNDEEWCTSLAGVVHGLSSCPSTLSLGCDGSLDLK